MNTPNKLTIARIIMIPFFVAFLMYDITGSADKWIALTLFVVASLTDLLDGYLARKYHLVTNFGKFMDPLADKLLVCFALLPQDSSLHGLPLSLLPENLLSVVSVLLQQITELLLQQATGVNLKQFLR